MSNFWKNLDIPFINCEVSLILTWPVDCAIASMEKRKVTVAQGDNPAVFVNSPTNAIFKRTDPKLHVPAVTLSTEDDNKLFRAIKNRI